jgi:predicted ABC-type ATPase
MPTLYIIGGCNGAGKTTASKSLLPEILNCREFVNADAIAAGISPYAPEKVAMPAGRIMLERIKQLVAEKQTFAIETTLSTKSYAGLVKNCKELGYRIVLIFFWLKSSKLAIQRVADRVSKGGHFIESAVIKRRYRKGITNLFQLFIPLADVTAIFNNSGEKPLLIAEYHAGKQIVFNHEDFKRILKIK